MADQGHRGLRTRARSPEWLDADTERLTERVQKITGLPIDVLQEVIPARKMNEVLERYLGEDWTNPDKRDKWRPVRAPSSIPRVEADYWDGLKYDHGHGYASGTYGSSNTGGVETICSCEDCFESQNEFYGLKHSRFTDKEYYFVARNNPKDMEKFFATFSSALTNTELQKLSIHLHRNPWNTSPTVDELRKGVQMLRRSDVPLELFKMFKQKQIYRAQDGTYHYNGLVRLLEAAGIKAVSGRVLTKQKVPHRGIPHRVAAAQIRRRRVTPFELSRAGSMSISQSVQAGTKSQTTGRGEGACWEGLHLKSNAGSHGGLGGGGGSHTSDVSRQGFGVGLTGGATEVEDNVSDGSHSGSSGSVEYTCDIGDDMGDDSASGNGGNYGGNAGGDDGDDRYGNDGVHGVGRSYINGQLMNEKKGRKGSLCTDRGGDNFNVGKIHTVGGSCGDRSGNSRSGSSGGGGGGGGINGDGKVMGSGGGSIGVGRAGGDDNIVGYRMGEGGKYCRSDKVRGSGRVGGGRGVKEPGCPGRGEYNERGECHNEPSGDSEKPYYQELHAFHNFKRAGLIKRTENDSPSFTFGKDHRRSREVFNFQELPTFPDSNDDDIKKTREISSPSSGYGLTEPSPSFLHRVPDGNDSQSDDGFVDIAGGNLSEQFKATSTGKNSGYANAISRKEQHHSKNSCPESSGTASAQCTKVRVRNTYDTTLSDVPFERLKMDSPKISISDDYSPPEEMKRANSGQDNSFDYTSSEDSYYCDPPLLAYKRHSDSSSLESLDTTLLKVSDEANISLRTFESQESLDSRFLFSPLPR